MTKLTADQDLVLGSASPRRRELLESLGLRLLICPPDIDETPRADELPAALLERLVGQKVAAVRRVIAAGPLLCADTAVIVDAESNHPLILGKPASEADARLMLQRLSGRTHQVSTAYCLAVEEDTMTRLVTTEVEFRQLTSDEIARYVAGDEWRDKAGGYAIQGDAAGFVRRISGSYTNVVGLPLAEVVEDLMAAGIVPGKQQS